MDTGEIDRACAIYAHPSQFCDPRVNSKFWAEWNSFEIETGSEDTFREMLWIKRSQFNTEASYLAAQTLSAKQNGAPAEPAVQLLADAMAAAEQQAGAVKGPSFVAAKKTALPPSEEAKTQPTQQEANADEIQISDEEDRV